MTQILNAVDAEQQEKLKNFEKSLKNIKVKRALMPVLHEHRVYSYLP